MRCFGIFVVVFMFGNCYAQGPQQGPPPGPPQGPQQGQPQGQPQGPPQGPTQLPGGFDFSQLGSLFKNLVSSFIPQPPVVAPSVANPQQGQPQQNQQPPQQPWPQPNQQPPQQPWPQQNQQPPQQPWPQQNQQPAQQPWPQQAPAQPSLFSSLLGLFNPQPAQPQVQPPFNQQQTPSIWSLFQPPQQQPQQPVTGNPNGNFLARILGAVSSGFLAPGSTLYETLNSVTSGLPKSLSGVASQPSGLMSILQSLPFIG